MQVSDFGVKVLLLFIVISLLPTSPFTGFAYLVQQLPFLGYLNWFIPIPEIIVILEAWLAIVAIYYGILFALNYVGILKQ